jgi:glycosyltransferase involved in cell wall biosynthesis
VPALRSADAAREICRVAGLAAEIIIIVDSPDRATQEVVERWTNMADTVAYGEYRNLGRARAHGLSLGNGEFFCFLDGDDVWQPEWPLLAHRFAKAGDFHNTIYHTEIFAGFGREYFLRRQIGTDDGLFHINHLVATWHFCNNLFAHRSIFERYPIESYDHESGFGSEDWHWSCQTCFGGLTRTPVPETVYYYRIDPLKPSLGMTPWLAIRETELFRSDPRVVNYNEYLGVSRASRSIITEFERIEDARPAPSWLVTSTRTSAQYDADLWQLLDRLGSLHVKTPRLYIGIAVAFGEIRRFYDDFSNFGVIILRTEGREPGSTAKLLRTINTAAREIPILVAIDRAMDPEYPVHRCGKTLYVDLSFLYRLNDEIPFSLLQLFSTVAVQFRPAFFLTVEHWFGHALSNYRTVLETLGIRYGYIGSGEPGDSSAQSTRILLARISNAACWYREIWLAGNYVPSSDGRLQQSYPTVQLRVIWDADLSEVLSRAIRDPVVIIATAAHSGPLISVSPEQEGKPLISCILNVHREREVLLPTLRSVARMLKHTWARGVATELLIICDDSDQHTRRIIERFILPDGRGEHIQVVDVSYKDLAMARNFGAQRARGEFVGFLDGDDLYSENWLTAAAEYLTRAPNEKTVVHPELNIYFGREHRHFWHPAWGAPGTLPHGLLFENYWTALRVCPGTLLVPA